jgi:8-oxo-dGTP diphosphatase
LAPTELPATGLADCHPMGSTGPTQRPTGTRPPERTVGLAGFVLPVRAEEVLLARHTYGPPLWAMVGGMALPGEPAHEAARREALEETGLAVSVGRLLAFADLPELALFAFAGQVELDAGPETPQAAEIAELAWFDAATLEDNAEAVFEFTRVLALGLLVGRPGAWERRSFSWVDGSVVPVHLEGPAGA